MTVKTGDSMQCNLLSGPWLVPDLLFPLSEKFHAYYSGCNQLSSVEENVVVAFAEVGGDDNNRITTTLNRAYKVRLIESRGCNTLNT